MVPVYILHAEAMRFSTTVTLRGFQLAEIGARFLGADYDFILRGVPDAAGPGPWLDDLRGGVVILSVGLAGRMPAPVLRLLRSRNRAVLADWMDGLPTGAEAELCDLHLFASLGAFRATRAQSPHLPCKYLTLNADLRLDRSRVAPQDRLRAIWPGDPLALAAMPSLVPQLAAPAQGARLVDLFPDLPRFNLHVIAGPCAPLAPLTPVFAAAACGAVAIVSRRRGDAVDYLGADYPYLTKDEGAGPLVAMLSRARAEFGGPIWRSASERMRNIKDRSSPGTVASDLLEILERVTASGSAHSCAA